VVTGNYTRYTSARPHRTKNWTTDALIEITNILEKVIDPQYWVKEIQVDWGSEFQNKNFQIELQQKRIQLKESIPRHSETDAIARTNQPIFTMSKAALIVANMPKGTNANNRKSQPITLSYWLLTPEGKGEFTKPILETPAPGKEGQKTTEESSQLVGMMKSA